MTKRHDLKNTKDNYYEKAKEFEIKRKEEIEELKKEREEIEKSTLKLPNDKVIKKSEIRNTEDFYQDQMKFKKLKEQSIKGKLLERIKTEKDKVFCIQQFIAFNTNVRTKGKEATST